MVPRLAELSIAAIDTTSGTLVRGINNSIKAEYVQAWKEHANFPPIVVFREGTMPFYAADGIHRMASAIEAGHDSIACEIHEGGKRDALEYALGSNSEHGLRRNNKDKRNAVRLALQDSEWVRLSNADVGRLCNVSPALARRVRHDMVRSGKIDDQPVVKTTRKGKTVERKASRESVHTTKCMKDSPAKSGTSKKRKRKTQADVAKEELLVSIKNTKSQPFSGAIARERGLVTAKDAEYMAAWWSEAAA